MTDYLEFVEHLVSENKTTGANQNKAMIGYTNLALKRMKRWDKIGALLPDVKDYLQQLSKKQRWVVLTEAWCGDAAHAFMFLEKMADASPNITLEWKLRDENLELMDQHLTKGGRAIPKLIAYDEEGNELFDWGPRPQHIQQKYWEMRHANVEYNEIMLKIQNMYNEDKGHTIQKEIIALMQG